MIAVDEQLLFVIIGIISFVITVIFLGGGPDDPPARTEAEETQRGCSNLFSMVMIYAMIYLCVAVLTFALELFGIIKTE